ncbi:MAG: restriction endonuclease [Thiothrix sp.]|nr:restriction endonuclease [Thiothrix sp.]
MKIVATYDFNGGKAAVQNKYAAEFVQIQSVIAAIDASLYKTKESTEKTMMGKMLFSPMELNKAFKREFAKSENGGWSNHKVLCDYSYGEYTQDYIKSQNSRDQPFRDMDFVKPNTKLGIEVQFGKYAFMVYNVCAKMTIFSNMGVIDTGIEIVPVKNFADEMSTGVSYFEQFAWDLQHRGTSDIDIPVLILGIDA